MPTQEQIETRIKKEFVTSKHFDEVSRMIVESAAKQSGDLDMGKLNIIISFRKAGENTIKMLSAGAGAKPHSVLDKSIKNDYLSKEDAGVRGIEKLYGLVPIRKVGKIIGLYLTKKGREEFRKKTSPKFKTDEKERCLFLSDGVSLEDFIREIGTDFQKKEYFLTVDKVPSSFMERPIAADYLAPEDQSVRGIENLYDLIPRREAGKIEGLYITGNGAEYYKRFSQKILNAPFEIDETKKPAKLKLKAGKTLEEFIEAILAEDAAETYAPRFITGDYDIHDMICKTGQIHPVPSDSMEEAEIIVRLNNAMAGERKVKLNTADYIGYRKYRQKEGLDEYDLIQHGPQYNYIAYTYNNERNEKIVEKVARIDTPVAVCSPDGWIIINTPEELAAYYTSHFIKVKDLWNLTDAGEEYIKARSGKSFRQFMDEKRKLGAKAAE